MNLGEHLRLTGGALKNWLIAQVQDSVAVGVLWLIGLYALKVPLSPLWAALAAMLQFVPHLGPVLGMVGPVLAATLHLEGLAASALCAHVVRGNRGGGWPSAAALHHEADS